MMNDKILNFFFWLPVVYSLFGVRSQLFPNGVRKIIVSGRDSRKSGNLNRRLFTKSFAFLIFEVNFGQYLEFQQMPTNLARLNKFDSVFEFPWYHFLTHSPTNVNAFANANLNNLRWFWQFLAYLKKSDFSGNTNLFMVTKKKNWWEFDRRRQKWKKFNEKCKRCRRFSVPFEL